MEIFNRTNFKIEPQEPVRSSMALLAAKLVFIVVIFDLVYSLIFYLLNIYFKIPIEFHPQVSLGMLFLVLAKVILEVVFLIYSVLNWVTTTYQIDEGHLVIKKGIIHTIEDVYELKTIRSVEVDQTLIGKLFHFGDVILKSSASGGYQVIVTLMGIANPYNYEKKLNKYF